MATGHRFSKKRADALVGRFSGLAQGPPLQLRELFADPPRVVHSITSFPTS